MLHFNEYQMEDSGALFRILNEAHEEHKSRGPGAYHQTGEPSKPKKDAGALKKTLGTHDQSVRPSANYQRHSAFSEFPTMQALQTSTRHRFEASQGKNIRKIMDENKTREDEEKEMKEQKQKEQKEQKEKRRFSYKLDPKLLAGSSSDALENDPMSSTSSYSGDSDEWFRPLRQDKDKKKIMLYPNKVYMPWYKRYASVLPEGEQIEFQPFEEIDKREEDIAMNFVYGDDWPDHRNEREMKFTRREAVNRLIAHKERLERREQKEQGTEVKRHASLESTLSGPSVNSILARRMQTVASDDAKHRFTETEKCKLKTITDYLRQKRQQTRRKRIIDERREHGFTVWNTKWRLLLKPKNKAQIHFIYKAQRRTQIRARFKRVINLVFACNRFFQILAELSGNTGKLVAEIREFTALTDESTKQPNQDQDPTAKFIFDPNSFKLFTDTPVSKSVLYTLTKPWFERTTKEIETTIKSLQVLRCFAELPTITQRIVASIAWFINIPEDKVLIRQSHVAQDYYIILSGRISRTLMMGDADDQEQPAVFRHLNTFSKDTIFGEEAITKPGCEREYSAVSCVKCDLLSINIHDYYSCVMTPTDPRAFFPDHIKFLLQCDFLGKFPRERMVTDAEGNISMAYFRPNSVVEFSMQESEWVYVVWWGTCQALVEMLPSGKPTENTHRFSMIPRDEEIVVMENRMTEPLRRTGSYLSACSSEDSTRRLMLSNHQKYVKKSIAVEMAHFKSKPTLQLYNEEEMDEIERKRTRIKKMLDAKRKQDLKQNFGQGPSRKESKESEVKIEIIDEGGDIFKLPSIMSKEVSKQSLNRRLSFDINGKVYQQDDDSYDSDNDQKSKDKTRLSTDFSKIAGHSGDVEKLYSSSRPSRVGSLTSDSTTFIENADRAMKSKWDSLGDDPEDWKPAEKNNQKLSKIRFKNSVEFSDSSFDLEKLDLTQRRSQRSRLSMEKVLDDQNIDKARSSRSLSMKTSDPYARNAEFFSRWKLRRTLIKGDEIGFEWVNLQDGKFRPGPELPALVSDGCELIMIRKTFLIDVMAYDGQQSRMQVTGVN